MALLLVVGVCASGCMTPEGATVEDQRVEVLGVRDDTIRELNRREPKTIREVATSAGYGVFANFGTQFLVLSTGNGYGVVVDNTTHQRTYMRTAGLGAGLGIGVREYRIVMIFRTRAALLQFVDSGWDFGGSGSAGLKFGETGGSAAGAASMAEDVKVYQFTETGVMLGGSMRGAKFWVDEDLNGK